MNDAYLARMEGLNEHQSSLEKSRIRIGRFGPSAGLDALFTARGPSSFLRGEPHIKRLFPNTRATEQAYYEKTRMFPIMHLVGVRKELVQKYPWLPSSLYKAFCEAKALAMVDLLDVNALMVTHPWLIPETEKTIARCGW